MDTIAINKERGIKIRIEYQWGIEIPWAKIHRIFIIIDHTNREGNRLSTKEGKEIRIRDTIEL